MSKRPSIASLAPKKASVPAPQASAQDDANTPEAAPTPTSRPARRPAPYKAILSKVDEATHKQMRRLAIDEGIPVGDLQIEAINMLFRSRGLPEIAVRVRPDETGRRRGAPE
ncbi:hypothetical protein SI859A1_03684 [Aurantimonas manganoxydans SI85-9A1]|uniref:Antitoxin-like ribbon-helix-helix domain-containing protein n=1 Tax=Aurantimonas manganoxydans (strain ATCC BAA-1229 / DSM 21871 / SI85-9A1) TaxID=287752 RepID=Q1YDF9_AURMS|nr:ribbon-helix-helix domain-containing protein [Aurantimonas manganoxydans]EAS48302.1 hypothetical protein SI859A1_03684 [Aurantimonas manganoxydans SI85-9A1]